ncbi:MAG: ADP-ribosylglycohydrolase family protein [Streptococcus salivarius]
MDIISKTLDEIRPTYRFNETCQDTVPQAIVAFWKADFEGAIRNAISLGGDSDTLAAITGEYLQRLWNS